MQWRSSNTKQVNNAAGHVLHIFPRIWHSSACDQPAAPRLPVEGVSKKGGLHYCVACGQLNQNQGSESRGTVASGWRARDGGQLEWRLILQSQQARQSKAQSLLEELQVFGVVTLRWSAGSVEV